MAAAKKRKKTAKKGKCKGVTKAGKVRVRASSETIAKALNRIESRVDLLEKNDAATYGLLLGMANSSRSARGMEAVKTLPGFAKPRLYSGGYGTTSSRKLLGG